MAAAERLVVVDASVALKWMVSEPGSEDANALLDETAGGSLALVAPEHLLGEVGNGLRKRVAQRVLASADAIAAFEALAELGVEFVADHCRCARWPPDRRWPLRPGVERRGYSACTSEVISLTDAFASPNSIEVLGS